jgi:hypothetical protein
MARPRNTTINQTETVEATDAAPELLPVPAEVVVPPPPAASQAPSTDPGPTPASGSVPPPQGIAQPRWSTDSATKAGLRRIGKGDQVRHVYPVDVADWRALGWQLLTTDSQED